MENELNFTSSYLLRRDRRWGDGDGNGTFTGMVGSAHAHKVDMVCASLTLKPSRAEGISFLHPIVFTNYALYIPSLGRYFNFIAYEYVKWYQQFDSIGKIGLGLSSYFRLAPMFGWHCGFWLF